MVFYEQFSAVEERLSSLTVMVMINEKVDPDNTLRVHVVEKFKLMDGK